MSNNSGFAATMYECNPAVAALNTVPGFDPLKLMGRRRMPGAEREERYLDFRYKKLWFRLAHKKGRIRLNKLSVTEQFAMIEAQVFLELTDAVPVSSFTAVCSREEDGDKYVESAQIKAMDQALTDAGFGLQFVPAPVESAGDAAAQAAAAPAVNVQGAGIVPKAVQTAANAAGKGQASVAASKAVQPAAQQRPQAAVQQQKATPQQAVVQQKTIAVPQQTAAVPQKPTATQAAIQQQSMVPQKPAAQTTVQQSAPQQVTAQQRPATQAVQQNPVMQQSVVQQRLAVQQPTPQQPTPQQRPVAAQTAAGVQKTAVDPEASVSSQKAAPAAATPHTAAGLPAGTENLSADQLPVAAEEQTLPVTSDMAAAMSMLSGRGVSDTLPVTPESVKTEEKAETVPEELPVAPTDVTVAPAVMGTAVPAETVSQAVNASAADVGAGQEAGEEKPYTETTPVDQILQFMTLEDAKQVVVPTGTCKGWTLDKVAQRRRPSLRFYLSEGYQGKDNILRAAASLVLDDLEKNAG